MHNLTLLLALVSLGAAGVLGFITWHVTRQDRQRSEARVAALGSAIDADFDLRDPSDAVAVSSMFETAPGTGAAVQSRPLIRLAVGVVMAVVLIVAAAMSNSAHDEPSSPAVAAQHGQTPLELVAMHHTREGNLLKVSGLVRNPPAGMPIARLTAIVFAFDSKGGFLASGRAPVDFLKLEPGDESPFIVDVPNVPNAARYRVSFRSDVGIVRHIDRRDDSLRIAASQ